MCLLICPAAESQCSPCEVRQRCCEGRAFPWRAGVGQGCEAIWRTSTSSVRNCRVRFWVKRGWNGFRILLALIADTSVGNRGMEQFSSFSKVRGRTMELTQIHWVRVHCLPTRLPSAFGCTATPEARQDVCSRSDFKRIFGISKILDCASVIFIYPCTSRGLSDRALQISQCCCLFLLLLQLIFIFFSWIIWGSQQSTFLIFSAKPAPAFCSSPGAVYLFLLSSAD